MERITPITTDQEDQRRSPIPPHEKQWALWCHLSGLAGFIIPFGNIIAPLIIWQAKKDEYASLDEHGKEVMNFQLSMTLYIFISSILIIVVIGIFAMMAVGIVSLILTIVAAVEVDKGNFYRYPLTIRFLK
ncbi:DUF4870 domain-containing protein [Roseivirga sp. BDSF3-8]|uniref:DUF4870 domain-containing protein n=1 Tax=Roseivirga sp. BDSF3-8 TaxID=3241598 RepID=UPI0035324D24